MMGKKVRCREVGATRQIVGWLVGSTYRRSGKTIVDYECGPMFVSTGPSRHVLLVRQWPTMRALDVDPRSVDVLPDDYEIQNPAWEPRFRKQMASIMSGWPRDARGRWIRKTTENTEEPET